MTTGLQAWGGYFPLDPEGFVRNPCRPSLVPSHLRPGLERAVEHLRGAWADALHSIWLRGSVPRGLFQSGLSDIDLFALIAAPGMEGWTQLDIPEELNAFPFELGVHPVGEAFSSRYPRMAMVVATQSLPLWGTDLRKRLPRYRPGPKMMLNYRWLEQDWRSFLKGPAKGPVQLRSIAKVILRTGFELVMERIGAYTPDLYWCWQGFRKIYPDQGPAMQQILEWYVNPPAVTDSVAEKIGEMVGFLLIGLRREGYL